MTANDQRVGFLRMTANDQRVEHDDATLTATVKVRHITVVLKSFEDFVALHGRLEKEGKHPRIVISA